MADERRRSGEAFEWVFDASETGLTIGVRIVDNDGGTSFARSTGVVTELGAGLYKAELTAPTPLGTYSIVADKAATSLDLDDVDPRDIMASASLEVVYAVTADPTGRDLCTLEDIRGYVPAYVIGESDVTDGKLAQLITSQSEGFMEETGREIQPAESQPETRTFALDRASELWQRVWIGDLADLDSARLLEADGTLCEEIDVDTIVPLYGEERQPRAAWEPITALTFPRAFSDRTELVRGHVLEVTGTWGFREIPSFVREAVAARVILRYVSDVAAAGTQFSEAIDSINAAALFAQARDIRLLVDRVVLA